MSGSCTSLTQEHKVILAGLLQSKREGVPISDLWRGFQYRGIVVPFTTFEDWVLDQEELVHVKGDGTVALKYGVAPGASPRLQIVPEKLEAVAGTLSEDRIRGMIRYYEACLREEGNLIADSRKQHGITFLGIESELSEGDKRFVAVRMHAAPDFFKNAVAETRTAFYGFPWMLEWRPREDSELDDYRVIPVFIARLDIRRDADRCIFQMAEPDVRLNPVLLKRLRWKDRAFAERTVDAMTRDGLPLRERLQVVQDLFPDIPVREELDATALGAADGLATLEGNKDGFYNRAGVFLGSADPYTRGLLAELSELAERPPAEIEETALAALLRSAAGNDALRDGAGTVSVYTPDVQGRLLNAAQELAAEEAFRNPITVVTGPPGTGKSQVVTAIMATAVLRGQSVLFASRNSKAIDVVQDRLRKACGDKDQLLRVGGVADAECQQRLSRAGNLGGKHGVSHYATLSKHIETLEEKLAPLEQRLNDLEKSLVEVGLAEEACELRRKPFLPQQDLEQVLQASEALDTAALLAYAQALERCKRELALLPRLLHRTAIRWHGWRAADIVAALHTTLETTKIRFAADWPVSGEGVTATLGGVKELTALLRAAGRVRALRRALIPADEASKILDEIIDIKKRIAAHVPTLLTARLAEAAGGNGLGAETDDAVNGYCNTIPMLRGNRLDDDQRRLRLAQLGSLMPDLVKRFPVWAVTNLSVRNRVPLTAGVFDVVIIDEAAQCDIASCVPLLYRGKRAVILGDPLQLPPITDLPVTTEDRLLAQYGLLDPINDHLRYSAKSLYDAARRVCNRDAYHFLDCHYRCNPEIIEFANTSHWYDDRLQVYTDIATLKRPTWWRHGIEWINVESAIKGGHADDYILEGEVDAAVEAVVDLLENRGFDGEVGVVCPFRAMVDRIRDRIEQRVRTPLIKAANLEVNTVHKFQGDERDVIVYVMGVHPQMPRGTRWFLAENRNLFNVALSRARAAFVVIGDKRAVAEFTHEGQPVTYLHDFVAYVESLSERDSTPQPESPPSFDPSQIWEEHFYQQALLPSGIDAISQYPVGPYKLDFAVLQDGRKLDIEVDGEMWHKDPAGHRLRRDIDRDIYMKARGWDVMRFWVYELKEEMQKCQSKVQTWINSKR